MYYIYTLCRSHQLFYLETHAFPVVSLYARNSRTFALLHVRVCG